MSNVYKLMLQLKFNEHLFAVVRFLSIGHNPSGLRKLIQVTVLIFKFNTVVPYQVVFYNNPYSFRLSEYTVLLTWVCMRLNRTFWVLALYNKNPFDLDGYLINKLRPRRQFHWRLQSIKVGMKIKKRCVIGRLLVCKK